MLEEIRDLKSVPHPYVCVDEQGVNHGHYQVCTLKTCMNTCFNRATRGSQLHCLIQIHKELYTCMLCIFAYAGTDRVAAVMSLSDLGQCLRVLGWTADVDLVLVNFDLEAGRQERVEPDYQVRVTFEEVRDTTDYPWSVNTVEERNTGRFQHTVYIYIWERHLYR